MRVALMSDVHGNRVALDAVLEDLRREPIDEIVSLGDVAQGGPQPAEVLDALGELDCLFVMGNSDNFLLELETWREGPEPITPELLDVREWTLSRLSRDHLDFLQSFEPTVQLELDGLGTLLCYHGSPTSFDDVILPDTPPAEFERMAGGRFAPLMAGGHVHLQFLHRHGTSLHLNPGSVGLAYDHEQPDDAISFDPWAQYAVVSAGDGRLGIEFRRVPFDPSAVVAAIDAGGRPHGAGFAAQWRNEARRG
jgi:predicted phosphodiesterase